MPPGTCLETSPNLQLVPCPTAPCLMAPRQFLWSFRLPGEAQKIDRMMEAFAQRYCLCNPGVFQSTGEAQGSGEWGPTGVWGRGFPSDCVSCVCLPSADTCYVLSFAVIMLNTSLHNPNVRDKPGLERFVAMNRGINEGGDLPEELLRVSPIHSLCGVLGQPVCMVLGLCSWSPLALAVALGGPLPLSLPHPSLL